MARKKSKTATEPNVLDYRHEDAKRKNIIAFSQGEEEEEQADFTSQIAMSNA